MIYYDLFKKVFLILNKDQKIFSFLILILTFVSILLETFGIATIFPLISSIVNENYFDNPFYKEVSAIVGLDEININIFFIFFLGFFIIKNLYLIFYNYIITYFSNKISLSVSSKLYSIYLKKNLSYRVKSNTAYMIRNIKESASIDSIVLRSLNLINEVLLILGIIILLIVVNPKVTFSILGLVAGTLIIYNFFTKNLVKTYGEKKFYFDGLYTKNLIEGLYAFREIILFNKKEFFINKYKNFAQKTLNFQLFFNVLAFFPRALIEIILIISIILLVFFLTNENQSLTEIIPILGLFSAAGLRLFPSALKIYSILQGLNYSKPKIDKVVEETNPVSEEFDNALTSEKDEKKIEFNNSIFLNNISFSYKEGKELIRDINLEIKKGETVGIIGKSGSGKSTLLNIISGLLNPTKGEVIVDRVNICKSIKSWREKIGYISQDIFLLDASIAENIAFGVQRDDINFGKIDNAIKMAELNDFILDQEKGYNTMIGEKGSKISGGQKQRLGIARAIYNNPEILLLDEATSSLDKDVENKILNTLKKLKEKFTIILISHHENPLKIADSAYELKLNRLNKIS
tara:strand:- start:804 stop:2531 length:1728 start_codon:yes stop_codon:yes gene_type:complete